MPTGITRPTAGFARVRGVRLHYEERGAGPPILCIHGSGGSSVLWQDAAERLARLGRVITYDRRGYGQSERPQRYARTSIREQSEDAVALLRKFDAVPAVVIGRSYGATVAADLALRHPDSVRALVLLEPDAPRALAPRTAKWVEGLADRLVAVAQSAGVEAVAAALMTEVAGEQTWRSLPPELRRTLSANGPAILAELTGEWWLDADSDALAGVQHPSLIVMGADSPPELSEPSLALRGALPDARTSLVPGGHLIDPAAPEVLAFVAEVLGRPASASSPDRAPR